MKILTEQVQFFVKCEADLSNLLLTFFVHAIPSKNPNLKKLNGSRFIVYNAQHISHIYGDAVQERPYLALTFVLIME
jgi:hypothetical protein